MDSRFNEIYDKKEWTQWGDIRSYLLLPGGLGQQLPELLAQLGVKSMLDIPCGDLHWMREVELGIERYIGADVVDELVHANRDWSVDRVDMEFVRADLVEDSLPNVDLIFCRDCLVHFCFDDIRAALRNIQESGATWLMTTTFPSRRGNLEIETGEWRPLNLERPPFRFPRPAQLFNERCPYENGRYSDKSLGLWKLADLGPFR